MKKVITMNDSVFSQACLQLFELANACNPQLIIGVASGGVFVVEKMELNEFFVVQSCRNNKEKKSNGFLKSIIKRLPRWLNDMLRNLENNVQLSKLDNASRNVHIDIDVYMKLNSLKNGTCILLVDDAVDSGNSLLQIIEEINKINSTLIIKSAVIVVTDKEKAKYLPDFYIYENVLIRFPWALDA